MHVTLPGLLTKQVPPASAHEGNVSAGESQVAVHVPPRQHGPDDTGHEQPTGPSAPDPSGVAETSALNCAVAPMLIADPPHRQLTVQ